MRMTAAYLFFIIIIAGCSSGKNENIAFPDWGLGPFIKLDSVNPVLQPDPYLSFEDPVLQDSIRWEQKDVFNPAAIVRNDTLFLIFRAEDMIGKYAGTSRIGLAYSTDGLLFTKLKESLSKPSGIFA